MALVCCEDTRRTGRLLQHAGIRADRLAVVQRAHRAEPHRRRARRSCLAGDDVALVTDAGTPGISDPGERLVRAALDAGYRVSAVPGPVAAVTALVISGLPTSRFVFEGFLPRSGKERSNRLADIAAEQRTVVIYEAPHRVQRTVHDLAAACGGDRHVALARELTKLYETVTRGSLGTIDIGEPRGEYVIVLAGRAGTTEAPDDDMIRSALQVAPRGGGDPAGCRERRRGSSSVCPNARSTRSQPRCGAPVPSPPRTTRTTRASTAATHTEGSR